MLSITSIKQSRAVIPVQVVRDGSMHSLMYKDDVFYGSRMCNGLTKNEEKGNPCRC